MAFLDFLRREQQVFTLAKQLKTSESQIPYPLSVKTTPEFEKIPTDQLEAAYRECGLIFNIINKTAQILCSVEYKLEGRKKDVEFYTNFLESIGSRGGEEDWTSILDNIFRSQLVFGFISGELITNKAGTEIIDLSVIDPKKFDYARTGLGKQIAFDIYGNPLGYTQTLPFISNQPLTRVQPPEGVYLTNNQLFFPPERVFHIKLYTIGDGFYSIGLIEPIYRYYQMLKAAELGYANSAHRVGFPLFGIAVGDETHQPTEDQLENSLADIKNISSRNGIAHAYWTKPYILEAKTTEKMTPILNYYIDQIVTGMGLPKPFATSSGEATNRATLARQEYVAKITLKDILRRTDKGIETQIFNRIMKFHNEANPNDQIGPVKIVRGEIALEELDALIDRISKLAKVGVVKPTPELEKFLRKLDKLPEDINEEAYKNPTQPVNTGDEENDGTTSRE